MRAVALCLSLGLCLAHADNFLVLPFFNVSQDPTLNWVGDSIAECVREALASQGLAAIDRSERTEAYQRLSIRPNAQLTKATVLRIGEALDAEQVVYGRFDWKPVPPPTGAPAYAVEPKTRGSLRIVTYVLDRRHMKQGPEFQEVGALEDLAALQRHVAWQTLRTVAPQAAPTEQDFVRAHPTVRADAIENYIRGLLASSPDEKHRWFTQAVHLDPHYSQPCFELGRLQFQKREYTLASEWFQKVSTDDVHYRESRFLLGLCRYHTGDFAGAQAAFQLVAALVPLNEVYNNLGAAQSRRNLPEAVESFRKALEGDESDPAYHFNTGYALWKQGSFAAAAERFRAVLERNPDDSQAKLLLDRCLAHTAFRPGDPRLDGLERLKTNYAESAWLQLKAALLPASIK